MASTAVPARPAIVEKWWFGFIVRTTLALLALWLLAFAEDRRVAFETDFRFRFEIDTGLWLAWIAPTIGAGFLFGLAAWLPFARVRYRWSRLLLSALAFAPIAQFGWLLGYQGRPAQSWLYRALWRADWFIDFPAQSALAVLAGVAIASGFRAARRAGDEE